MTLYSVVSTITGLYHDPDADRRYVRDEALTDLPSDALLRSVALRKVDSGVYEIVSADNRQVLYVLYSRRRHSRDS